jgi:hypothetical protein
MPTKSAAKKATRKASARIRKAKSLSAVKPLSEPANVSTLPKESVGMNYSTIKFDYR